MEPFWESALENHQAGMYGSRWTNPKLIDSLVQCNPAATDNWMTNRSPAVCAPALQKERDGSRGRNGKGPTIDQRPQPGGQRRFADTCSTAQIDAAITKLTRHRPPDRG